MKKNDFPKDNRLLRRKEFIGLKKKGKKYENQYFIATACQNCLAHSRIGITASKRIGKAFKRNRLKRIIREYFRKHKNNLPGHLDINLIIRYHATQQSSKKIYQSLDDIFGKLSGG